MEVTFQIPDALAQQLKTAVPDVSAAALEAFLVAMYRRGKITDAQIGMCLRLDRLQIDELLARHGLYEDPTEDDINVATRMIRDLRRSTGR